MLQSANHNIRSSFWHTSLNFESFLTSTFFNRKTRSFNTLDMQIYPSDKLCAHICIYRKQWKRKRKLPSKEKVTHKRSPMSIYSLEFALFSNYYYLTWGKKKSDSYVFVKVGYAPLTISVHHNDFILWEVIYPHIILEHIDNPLPQLWSYCEDTHYVNGKNQNYCIQT